MADKRKVGDIIRYPGMDEEEKPGMWSGLMDYLHGAPKEAAAAPPSPSPSPDGPELDPDKVRQFQRGFYGQ